MGNLKKTIKGITIRITSMVILASLFTITPINAQEDVIPSWFRNIAWWWVDEKLTDANFIDVAEFLVNEGIMKIPPTSQGTGTGSNQIPSWIKGIAKSWVEQQIPDSSFVQVIQSLINEGMIKEKVTHPVSLSSLLEIEKKMTPEGLVVIWSNLSTVSHTVTSGTPENYDGLFDSGMLNPGKSFRFVFEKDGTYKYFCMIHPWETSALLVNIEHETKLSATPKPEFVDPQQDPFHLTESVIATLDIKSTNIAIHESAKKAYVVSDVRHTGDSLHPFSIKIINTTDYSVISTIDVPGSISSKIIIDEINERAYFLFSDDSRIGVIDTENDKFIHEVHKGPSNGQLVIDPSKKLLYFVDREQNKLLTFSTKNDDFSDEEFYKSGMYLTELKMKNPAYFAVNENTNRGYMTEDKGGIIHIFDLETNSEIDSFTNCCNTFLLDFVVDSSSNMAYSVGLDYLNVIDLNAKKVASKIPVDVYTRSMDINFKTQRVYLVGDEGMVIVDLKTKKVLGSLELPIGWVPDAIAIDESTGKAFVVDNLGKSFVMDLDCDCPKFLDEMKLQADEEKLQKEREGEIQEQIKAIRGDWYYRTLQPFTEVPSTSEILDMMGKEKAEKYKKFSEGLQSRNIQAKNLELLLSSDKITLEERKIILNYFEDGLLVMKTFAKDRLNEYDDTVQQIINEINEKDLPDADKSQLIKEIQFDSDTRRNQILSAFADVIEPLESTLAKEKSKQGIIDELTSESPIKVGGGGCLIATATYGSELSPQVQQLRELRDNSLLHTASGTSFMSSFNYFYYSFSPTVADWERENPAFKEAVKITLTPMISSLSILNYVDMDSEDEVLGYGISLILLNVGMYFIAPAIVIVGIKKKF